MAKDTTQPQETHLVPIEQIQQIVDVSTQKAVNTATYAIAEQFKQRKADFDDLVKSDYVPEDIKKEFWQLKVAEIRLKQDLAVAEHFVRSGAFTKDVQNAGQALVKIQAGREIGLSPAESMTGLYLVNGNVTPWGVTLTKQLRKHGWDIEYGKCDKNEATVTIRKGEVEHTFTGKRDSIPNSKALGFAPEDKLKWHTISRLCRFYVPEVMGSMQYVAEELEGSAPIGEIIGKITAKQAADAERKAEVNEKREELQAQLDY